ncbi:hypothetical protein [Streptomyces roseochromogenus]|uniref:Uncharacterized protein n=1 Tax=Streptomyces roseochromogenus subsp. oscitans DS 12.976 TaxID=1352936 RepID=V6KFM5_STRRC|nr:hypothetical protein M878_18985 [Streptomyces roseochromogenus subsp. oscitans DS 12.976]
MAVVAARRLRRRVVFFTGFGAGFLNLVLGAVLFARVPRRLPGRVDTPADSVARAGVPLGGLIAGAVVAPVGLVSVLLIAGAAYFLTTNLAGLRGEWSETGHGRGGPAAVPPVEGMCGQKWRKGVAK